MGRVESKMKLSRKTYQILKKYSPGAGDGMTEVFPFFATILLKGKTKMKKLFLLLVLIFTLAPLMFGCEKDSDSIGEITVIVENNAGDEVFNETIAFGEDDTLLGLLQNHPTIALKGEEQTFGFYITEVYGIDANDYERTYWSISVNGEYSLVGIGDIELIKDDVITFSMLTY